MDKRSNQKFEQGFSEASAAAGGSENSNRPQVHSRRAGELFSYIRGEDRVVSRGPAGEVAEVPQ